MSYYYRITSKKSFSQFYSTLFIFSLSMLFSGLALAQNKIYWTQQFPHEVRRANFDGSNSEQLVSGLNYPEGIALDIIQGKMYWVDRLNDRIQRANLDGSSVETIVSGLSNPYGVALDLQNNKIYWTDEGSKKIQRANLNGSNIEDVWQTTSGFVTLKIVALDIQGGKMYWTNSKSSFGGVLRADLDGTNVENLVGGSTTGAPTGLALDLNGGKMYWTMGGTKDDIQRANLDGSNIQNLITSGIDVGIGLTLDIDQGKIYWSDGNDDVIQRANLDGSIIENVVTPGLLNPVGLALAKVPAAPILIIPSDGATEQQTSLTVQWKSVKNSSSYQIQVSATSDFTDIIIDESGIAATSFQISGLTQCTTYYWRVRAANAVGSGAWSDVWSFTTIILEPTATSLVSPSDGETTVQIDPTLIWNSAFCADSYRLEVSTDSNFSTLVVEQSGITDTSFAVSSLPKGTSYYWRVNSNNNVGTSDWSDTWTFTTILAAPAAPSLVSPADSETGVTTDPTLVWNASTQASSYQLQVSTTVSFSATVVDQSDIADTTLSVSALTNNTTYFWRVNATNEGGTSGWSSIWQFTTIVAAPATPTLASPSDGATGIQTNPTLSWNISSGANSYNLQVATSPSFSNPTIDQSEITETSFAVSGLLSNTGYFWRVNATNEGGTSDWSTIWSFATESPTSVEQRSNEIPKDFRLGQNYPNPFNPITIIEFDLPKAGFVTLTIYNALGEEVVSLISHEMQAGKYTVQFDAGNLASGLYLYKLQSASFVNTRKMLLVR